MPKATVLIPTHNHYSTLPMTIASMKWQKEQDFEIIIIGDGVTEAVRQVAKVCAEGDARIRFLDLPKGAHHGDLYRDLAIRQSLSENIFYLCDDDLFLPSHLSNLLSLLETHDFVQSRNGYIDLEQKIHIFPTDLSKSFYIDWHLKEPHRNAVSLTGTAHRKSTYLKLPIGWQDPPPHEWTDHFMWKKFFRLPGLRAATHNQMTALQLPTSMERESMGLLERRTELQYWYERFSNPEAELKFQAEVVQASMDELNYYYAITKNWEIDYLALEATNRDLENQIAELGLKPPNQG